jgi:hypothetical protein
MHLTKTTRLLIIILASVCSQVALGQSKERIIPLPEWSLDAEEEAQLELVEIKIAGKPIAIGESFDADENWLKAMTLRVKNISKKPIITFVLVSGLLEAIDEELQPSASFRYGIAWKWGKDSKPGKAQTKRIVFKPGEILELSYAHVNELNRKVLAKRGEGAFCKLEFMAPAIQYEDGTESFSPYMRFQRKQ